MKTDILVVNCISVKRKKRVKKQRVSFKIKRYKIVHLFKACIPTTPGVNHTSNCTMVNDPINVNITFTYGEANEIKH